MKERKSKDHRHRNKAVDFIQVKELSVRSLRTALYQHERVYISSIEHVCMLIAGACAALQETANTTANVPESARHPCERCVELGCAVSA